jgi:hypothetical protein
LSGWFDGELPPDERAGVESVVSNSPEARQLLSDFATLSNLLQDQPRPEVPPEFTARVLQAAERSMLLSTGAAVLVPDKPVVVREPAVATSSLAARPSRRAHRWWLNVVVRCAALVLVLGAGTALWQNRDVNNRAEVAADKSVLLSRSEPATAEHRPAAMPVPGSRPVEAENRGLEPAARFGASPEAGVGTPAPAMLADHRAKARASANAEAEAVAAVTREVVGPGGAHERRRTDGDADPAGEELARKQESETERNGAVDGVVVGNAFKPASELESPIGDSRMASDFAKSKRWNHEESFEADEPAADPEVAIAEAILPPNDAEAELVTNEIVNKAVASSRYWRRNASTSPRVVPLHVTVPDVEEGMMTAAVTFQQNWIPTDVEVPADAVMRILSETSNADDRAILDADEKAELERLMLKAAAAKVEPGEAKSQEGEPQYNAYLVNTTVGQLRGWVSLMKQRNAYTELSVGDEIPSSQLPDEAQSQLTNMLSQNTAVPIEFTNRDRTIGLYDQYRTGRASADLWTGDGVTDDGIKRVGVTGDGVMGDAVTGDGVTGDGVTGDGVTGDGVAAAADQPPQPLADNALRGRVRRNAPSIGSNRSRAHQNANRLATPGESPIGNSNFFHARILPEDETQAGLPLPQTPPALALQHNATASWSYALLIDEKQLPSLSSADMKAKAAALGRNSLAFRIPPPALFEQQTAKDGVPDGNTGNPMLNDPPVDLRPVQVLIVLRQGVPVSGGVPATPSPSGNPISESDPAGVQPIAPPAAEPQPEPLPGPMQ